MGDGTNQRMRTPGFIPPAIWNAQNREVTSNVVRDGGGIGVRRTASGTTLEAPYRGAHVEQFHVSVEFDKIAGSPVVKVRIGYVLVDPGTVTGNWEVAIPEIGGTPMDTDPPPDLGEPASGFNAVYAKHSWLNGGYDKTEIVLHTDDSSEPTNDAGDQHVKIAEFTYDPVYFTTEGLFGDITYGTGQVVHSYLYVRAEGPDDSGGSAGSSSSSAEKTAIVAMDLHAGEGVEYVGFFCTEQPEPAFEDALVVMLEDGGRGSRALEREFVEGCVMGSIMAVSAVPMTDPVALAAEVVGTTVHVRAPQGTLPQPVVVKVRGRVKHHAPRRFKRFTREQWKANTKFYRAAHGGG